VRGHYQGLSGAAVVATEALLDARDLIEGLCEVEAMGAIHGPAGTGKSFAVAQTLAGLSGRREWARTDLRARPTLRDVRAELIRLLGLPIGKINPFETDQALKNALARGFRLIVIDEAQWLNRECFEYLRYLHDDARTRFALLFVGGDGCYEVLRREPMLDSRIWAHQRFGALTPAEVMALLPGYHPIYTTAEPCLLRLIDEVCAHGNFRSWARFTHHAARLVERTGRPGCDEEIARNAFRCIGGGQVPAGRDAG
jgi:hypothetical protein